MKQVIQDFKSGELLILDAPIPEVETGFVLVRNRFSLISAGTERSTVKVAKASLIGKARQRPDLVRQVLGNVRKEGLRATVSKVRTKLDSFSALGYSTSGSVHVSRDTNGRFLPGDRVACAGQNYASHAEFIRVPQNLVAKIPDNVPDDQAAFTTLGAIALQGVRQASPTLGESVCVIGLGLLGQITAQLLRANGCRVFGVDLSQDMVDLANRTKSATAENRARSTLSEQMSAFNQGRGFDKVIVTAATESNDPLVLATEILRKKGRIVLVGAVPIKIPRDPHFYRNELELRISCSYGPGRYDPNYEEEGHDYPLGYVRWTEQRNMEAFLELLSSGTIDLAPLITNVFDIDQALDAYNLVEGSQSHSATGILFRYSQAEIERSDTHHPKYDARSVASDPRDPLVFGFIGAGGFAESYLLPNLKSRGKFHTVSTATGIRAENIRKKFSFDNATTKADEILANDSINTVFIATRHNTHARFVVDAIKAEKAVFVEKPLCLNRGELSDIVHAYEEAVAPRVMVGFNRRFSPLGVDAAKRFSRLNEPLLVQYRINAGFVPRDHWTQREEGGGRILGEICHFVDFIHFLCGSVTRRVFATALRSDNANVVMQDNVSVSLELANGSVGQILYTSLGDRSVQKERIEIFGGGRTYAIKDFERGVFHENNRVSRINERGKGHKEELEQFCEAIVKGEPLPIGFGELINVSETTFGIVDSLATGEVIEV